MSTRLPVRLHVVVLALWRSLLTWGRRHPSGNVRRVLVTHHPQMLGDTLLLTPLLAKLRARHPAAEIVLTASRVTAPLYQKRPYGVTALTYDPHDHGSLNALLQRRGFDLALVPGDNRYSWLARAMDSAWIAGFAGDRPQSKNWMMDQLTPYPDRAGMWGDLAAGLIEGAPAAPFKPEDWPAPDFAPFDLPPQPYCVLHVGASTVLKQWSPENWRKLAEFLAGHGLGIVWSGGPGEQRVVDEIDPERKYPSLAGRLDLPQLWQLFARARLLVCPDTGAAHLGRIVGIPTVALFGPGSPVLCGAGEFWRNSPYRAVTVDAYPCRDQRVFFRRSISWVRRCGRSERGCATPGACMEAIQVSAVKRAIEELSVLD